ncbi:hypothetical protein J4G08_19420 [Candidatus Poribacteria bacterium]|nr:hypothetical protein [Candidatus Poribacteria bacterium]
MENVLEVYKDINNYKAVVQTYKAESMDVSGSIYESQEPIISFNLFFRKPDEHVVQEIGRSRYGIFRVELLSALSILKDKNIKLKQREVLLGHNCHVLECTSPEDPETVIQLWISSKNWSVQQFILIMKSLTMVKTQFKYPLGGNRRIRYLPVETRSFFPLSRKVLINRIANYEVNTVLSPELFEKRKNKEEHN